MRFRLAALAIALVGFLAINYSGNEYGQRLILDQIDTPEEVGRELSAEDRRLEGEIELLSSMRAMIDTFDALGVQTIDAVEFRRKYRATVDHLERLRVSYFMSQTIWRQTVMNMLWGILVVIFLLPLALVLDRRYPVGRIRTDEGVQTASTGTSGIDEETEFPE